MKTYIKILVSLLFLFAAYVFIFNKNTEKDKVAENLSTIENQSTTTEIIISENPSEFFEISAKYPIESRDKENLMKKMVLAAVDEKKEEWKIGGESYNQKKELDKEFGNDSDVKYLLSIGYDKYESKDKDVVNYLFQNYEFTGGAHGNTAIITYSFDNNGLVDINNILNLNEANTESLKKILKTKLASYLEIDLNDPDNYFAKDTMELGVDNYNFKNFIILDEGIKFIFGQYEVGPYAVGTPEVLISWKDLQAYLK